MCKSLDIHQLLNAATSLFAVVDKGWGLNLKTVRKKCDIT
ncbi:hypothetical protein VPBB_0166 [Vibrio parahaemolyticus BB22OP]|nr:hypothetical protein VPBB_0166 [Vibrio parahaemolyticus BB22OP]